MENKVFERKCKEDKPVLAICYDFDKTLSPDDMQAQGYIQSVGCNVSDFWQESNKLAGSNDMDQNLAWMLTMKMKAEGKVIFTKEELMKYGAQVRLFPGVEEWFDRIREYGEERGVIVEHYIISSGLKEMIEGTKVAEKFEKIYASSFYYNENNVAVWPAQVINYTNKTQFLYRIEKGVLDINDQGVNESFSPEEMRVPFRNMVYIGDSDTDIPCMKLVNKSGGHSIGVFNAETKDKTKVHKMLKENRIRYYVPADYSEGKELDTLIKAIIDKTKTNEYLEEKYYNCKKETNSWYRKTDKEEQKKTELIIALEGSGSFATTHEVIGKMQQYREWASDERKSLYEIALNNGQVRSILKDLDVKAFYQKLLSDEKNLSEKAKKIEAILNSDE